MIEEIDLFGVYIPAALGWAVVAGGVTALLRPALRLPWLRWLVWQPGQLELTCFLALWWAFSTFADRFSSHAMVPS